MLTILSVQQQAEIFMDSQMMTITSNVYNNCTLSLSQNISSYDYKEFAEKLVSSCVQQFLAWKGYNFNFIADKLHVQIT